MWGRGQVAVALWALLGGFFVLGGFRGSSLRAGAARLRPVFAFLSQAFQHPASPPSPPVAGGKTLSTARNQRVGSRATGNQLEREARRRCAPGLQLPELVGWPGAASPRSQSRVVPRLSIPSTPRQPSASSEVSRKGGKGHPNPTSCRPGAGPVAGLNVERVVLKLLSTVWG